MPTIAVIADTHDRLSAGVLCALHAAAVDEIWHLGDVTGEGIIAELAALGAPVRVVRGNCDYNYNWPTVLDLKRGNLRFRLQHHPPVTPRDLPAGIDILLHGHTHVPRDEMSGGVRLLNPGSVGKPNKGAPPSYALLTITANGEVDWQLVKI